MAILTTTQYHAIISEPLDNTRAKIRKGDINVYSEVTGKRVNRGAFETVEEAIAYVERTEKAIAERKAKIAAEAEKQEQEEKKAEQTAQERPATEPLATPRQVNYIMSLLAQHDGQNTTWFSAGPTTIEGVQAMTRRDASTYISALKGA